MGIPIFHLYHQQVPGIDTLRPADLKSRITAQLIDGFLLSVVISVLYLLFSRAAIFSVWISPVFPVYIIQVKAGELSTFANWWWGGYYFNLSLPFTADFYLAVPAPLHFTVYCIYYSFFISNFGQTPGKMMKGLVVIDEKNQTLSLKWSCLRWLFSIISLLPLGAGIWRMNVDKGRQAWHDEMVNSKVCVFFTPGPDGDD